MTFGYHGLWRRCRSALSCRIKASGERGRAFLGDETGTVAVMGALSIVAILAVSALALEGSSLYIRKLNVQRVADVANLAAANTPNAIVDDQPSARALATARQVAVINGQAASDIAISVTTSSDGVKELSVETMEVQPFILGTLISNDTSANVDGRSSARPVSIKGDCVRSMHGPVNIYGNTVLDGPDCLIAAATYLYTCGKTKIAADSVEVKYTLSQEKAYACASATVSPGLSSYTFAKASVDPLVADPRVLAIKKRLKAMSSWPYATTIPRPLDPATSGGSDRTFSGETATLSQSVTYRTLVVADSTLNFTGSGADDPGCNTPTVVAGNIVISGTSRLVFAPGCYAIGGYITIADGSAVTFENALHRGVTLAMKQYIRNGAATTTFDDMTVSIKGNIDNTASGRLTFGNGPFSFGAGVNNASGNLTFGNGPFYFSGGTILNNTGKMAFGDGVFYLKGGSLANQSTGTMTFGNGPFYFYGGTVTNVKGTMIYGDGDFEFYGGSLALNDGSITQFGKGNMNFYGGTATFAGKKTIIGGTGDPKNGSSSFFFYGGSLSITTDEMVASGTTFGLWGGTFSLYDIGTATMTAPRSPTPVYGYSNILFYVYGGAFNIYQRAVTDILSGIIYVPDTNVSIYGKQTITVPDDGCFQVIGGIVDLYQDTKMTLRPCAGTTGNDRSVRITQ